VALLTSAERKALTPFSGTSPDAELLKSLLQTPDWHDNPGLAQALKAPLLRLCARYLVKTKRRTGTAYDRVAHFHLSNGARIERLNWLANVSERGLRESYGIMVNYRYKLDDIETNHEAYRGENQVRSSSSVRSLRP
jgi:malonyl-CoA decarboxylase